MDERVPDGVRKAFVEYARSKGASKVDQSTMINKKYLGDGVYEPLSRVRYTRVSCDSSTLLKPHFGARDVLSVPS